MSSCALRQYDRHALFRYSERAIRSFEHSTWPGRLLPWLRRRRRYEVSGTCGTNPGTNPSFCSVDVRTQQKGPSDHGNSSHLRTLHTFDLKLDGNISSSERRVGSIATVDLLGDHVLVHICGPPCPRAKRCSSSSEEQRNSHE
jgi:hypothetical protein